ncbi:glycerate kinase [Saccharothrix deserti]|uniref:glycerate kinase n=1 Tax=Saccharothrix deserti TaxID=2593674 RepID=UPI00131AA7C5|nr:glycerate kinase [Saccharothrix deserti]
MDAVVVALDEFKGSLDAAARACTAVAAGLRRTAPGLDVRYRPVADCGDAEHLLTEVGALIGHTAPTPA